MRKRLFNLAKISTIVSFLYLLIGFIFNVLLLYFVSRLVNCDIGGGCQNLLEISKEIVTTDLADNFMFILLWPYHAAQILKNIPYLVSVAKYTNPKLWW